MSDLYIMSWLLCLSTSIIFMLSIYRWRYLLVKPSMMFALFFHVQVQYPSAIYWPKIELFLTSPFPFFVLAQIFPPLLILGSICLGQKSALIVYQRIVSFPISAYKVTARFLLPLAFISLIILSWYLYVVPWKDTGLYAVIFQPSDAAIAREQSLKLLSDQSLKYTISLFNSTLAPILACLIGLRALYAWQTKAFLKALFFLSLILPILLTVSLSGARAPSAMILLAVIFTILITKGLPINPIKIAFLAAIVLIIPGLISLLRNAADFNLSSIIEYYTDIFDRAIGQGMIVDAQWHLEYVNRFGFWGIAGIEKLAGLFDVNPINILNVVGKYYRPDALDSISANTSTIFLYYSCFGWWALPLCLVLGWILDLALIGYRLIKSSILIVCVAVSGIAAGNLAHTGYTTIFITHGFLSVLMLCIILDELLKSYKKILH